MWLSSTAFCGLFLYAAIVLGLVAWAKALLATPAAEARGWFRALLWGGIAGIVTAPVFGLVVLVFVNLLSAYAIAGPDESTAAAQLTPAKATVRRWSWGFAAGGAGAALALTIANLTNPGGALHGRTWPSLALEWVGISIMALGAIAVGVAWWAALFNAHDLADKKWFKRILWGGIIGVLTMPLFGLGVLILALLVFAYSRRAPDATSPAAPNRLSGSKPPIKLAS